MTREEQKAVEEFTEMNLTKKGLYHYNDMQDAFLIGLFKGENMQPSLPSNLDEAAEEWCKTNNKGIALSADKKSHYLTEGEESFKAGAEWMAGQFQKIEGDLVDWYSTSDGKDYCCGIKTNEAFEVPEGFYIRKKQPGESLKENEDGNK